MKVVLLISLALVSIVHANVDLSTLDEKKKTVCSVTINSSEEIDTFKSKLSHEDFQFIELTDFYPNPNPGEYFNDSEKWFNLACESQVRCDVLVISGHFGGSFFGESGLGLKMDQLEAKSCNNSCDGILNNPKEVFLFGCNTLAEKAQDHRTREEYIEVLLRDNISAPEAERIANARYSSMGTSFKQKMSMSFGKVEHIYGFDSVGPSGKTVKAFLDNYFNKIDDYRNHLDKTVIKSLSAFDQKNINNLFLEDSLKTTAFAQCRGAEVSLDLNDPKDREKQKLMEFVCRLKSDDGTFESRVATILDIIAEDKLIQLLPNITEEILNMSGYLKASEENNGPGMKELKTKLKTQLEILSQNQYLKDTVDFIARHDTSLNLKIEMLTVQKALGHITLEEYPKRIRAELLKIMPVTNRFDAESMLFLGLSGHLDSVEFTDKELEINENSTVYEVLALKEIIKKRKGKEYILNLLDHLPKDIIAAHLASFIITDMVDPSDSELINKVITKLINKDFEFEDYLNTLSHMDGGKEAAKNLQEVVSQNPKFKDSIMEKIKEGAVMSRLRILNDIKPTDPKIKQRISKLYPDFEFEGW